MREIKFRAWDGTVMVNGMPIVLGRYINFPQIANTVWIPDMTEQDHEDGKHWTLMEFTGLKDKNGKEIYEGDIVEKMISGKKKRAEVIYDPPIFYGLRNILDCEVIGNIYENPELLK